MAEEKSIYPIGVTISKDTIEALKAFHGSQPGAPPFAGLCVAPRKNAEGNTDGLIFVTVGFGMTAVGADELKMFTHPGLMSLTMDEGVGERDASYPIDLFQAAVPSTETGISGLSRFFDYNRTREFDYAFIDATVLDYFLNTTAIYPEGTNLDNRGIKMERALVIFDTDRIRPSSIFFSKNESGVYRTLKFTPVPEPLLSAEYTARAAIAYYISPPCPPFWFIGTNTDSISPVEFSFPAQQLPPENRCNCPIYNIDRRDFVKQLTDMGLMPKEPYPLYTMRRWPYIVLGIVALLLFVFGAITLTRWGITGFKFPIFPGKPQ
jgi:hypothetical protein